MATSIVGASTVTDVAVCSSPSAKHAEPELGSPIVVQESNVESAHGEVADVVSEVLDGERLVCKRSCRASGEVEGQVPARTGSRVTEARPGAPRDIPHCRSTWR